MICRGDTGANWKSLKGWNRNGSSDTSTWYWITTQSTKYILFIYFMYFGLPGGSDGKESVCNAGRPRSIPWRRKWQPALVFLPGEFHGQRSLVGYRPWGHTESDTAEGLTHTHKINMHESILIWMNNWKNKWERRNTSLVQKNSNWLCTYCTHISPHCLSVGRTYWLPEGK